jgi:hypothetical protein
VPHSLWLTVVLVVGAFIATILFAYLFGGTATARAVRPMMGASRGGKQFDLALLRQVPRCVVFFLFGLAAAWGIVFPFEVIGDDMMQTDFGYSPYEGGFAIALCPMLSIFSPILAPFLGTTPRQKLVACGTGLVLLTTAFLIIGLLRLPILGIATVGTGYAISICAFYSTMPLLVKESVPADIQKSMEGLVVGLNMAGSGTSMIMSNLAIGIIKDRASYPWACIYLASMGFCGLLSVIQVFRCLKPVAPAVQDQEPQFVDDTGIGGVELDLDGPSVVMTTIRAVQPRQPPSHPGGSQALARECGALEIHEEYYESRGAGCVN